MTVESCVKVILCGLGQAALGALQGIIEAQVTALQAQKSILTSQLLALDVAKIPVEAGFAAATAIIDEVRSAGNLVPINIIAGCADLGDMMTRINDTIDQTLAEAETIKNDAVSLLSFAEELAALNNEIDDTLALYQDVLDVLSTCFE